MEPIHTPSTSTPRRGRPWLVGLGIGLGFTALFVAGLVPRMHRQAELAAASSEAASAVPTVSVAAVTAAPATTALDLPGEIKAYQEAAVFARANGYLKRRLVDIGDRVSAGQLLAEVESPELDKELLQAKATLAQAEANLAQAQSDHALAATTATRWAAMRKDGSVSQQDADEKQAAYLSQSARVASVRAAVTAARSNVSRLETLTRFERVEAPFTGTITSRGVDPGALIGNGANGAPLFKLVQLDRLRIAVAVPQPFAPAIARGQAVKVAVRELGRAFDGRVVRTAGALDPATRTLLTEVELANNGKLMPGMFARVKLTAARSTSALLVPGNAIVTRGHGATVAVVDGAGVVHVKPIETGSDDGKNVEVTQGLKAGEQVVIGPGDEVKDGAKVRSVPFKED